MESKKEVVFGHAILLIGALIALYPFVSIILQALTPAPGSGAEGWTLENFISAWTRGGFSRSLLNSAIVAFAVVVATAIAAMLAGYVLSVLKFEWRVAVFALLMIGLVLPSEARIIPLYNLFASTGLLNSYWALILPQIASSFPLATFWMANYYAQLPESLSEAASLDGASEFEILRHIYAPIGMSAVLTLSCLVFLFTWNEFMLALVLMPDNVAVQTAPLSLSFFAGNERTTEPQVIAAAAVLVALPVVVAYFFLQRRFMQGLLEGAVK
ncbi:sugar ABC transporter permease [Devosia pacifica]|uniref:sn-glycerol-3-phosphate transport system permease protein UgpE n=1 Tax=Devosia pacifica TaxID=1335967 RepID=A0A918S991_9HYPH|nr:carbohydrate ABC transporter permease [Devosia pacifica]GHA29903.1 sugar ABC transporter permease [Devosia pacifica]